MKKDKDIETIAKVHKIRRSNECIFKNVIFECKSNGNLQTERNHIISKSSHLKVVSNHNRVMVFDYEQKEYYKNGGLLIEKNIDKANRYRVFCGEHDKYVFNEIENGKLFSKSSDKQCFQFAFRAFIFHYSESLVKRNFNLVPYLFEKVAEWNYKQDIEVFERFKKDYENGNWKDIESKVIIIKRKIQFVSCFYARPNYNIDNKRIITQDKVSFNIFPNGEETIILMSYFKESSKSIVEYCEKLCGYAEDGREEELMQYFTKVIIAYDPNLALNPILWNRLSQVEKESFYEFAHLLKKNNRYIIGILKKLPKLRKEICKCNLFLELT